VFDKYDVDNIRFTDGHFALLSYITNIAKQISKLKTYLFIVTNF